MCLKWLELSKLVEIWCIADPQHALIPMSKGLRMGQGLSEKHGTAHLYDCIFFLVSDVIIISIINTTSTTMTPKLLSSPDPYWLCMTSP